MASDTDNFEAVIAEALRAGPASPAWREAVDRLKAQGQTGEDWTLLVKARERLEQGRTYRSIRAGEGFTRKLMGRLEETPQTAAAGVSPAAMIAAAAALVILFVVGVLAWNLFSSGEDPAGRVDLRNLLFVNTRLAQSFDDSVPEHWKRLGALPTTARNGLRVQPPPIVSADYAGGGLLLPFTPGAREPFAIEAVVDMPGKPANSVVQLFVSESADFSPDRGTAPRELVLQLDQKQSRVITADGQGAAGLEGNNRSRLITLRLLVSRDKCLVEQDGRTIWTGNHALAEEGARFIGVRLLTKGDAPRDGIVVRSVVVRAP